MKRILFLDDNPARLAWARGNLGPGATLHLAETARGAIGFLEAAKDNDQPFDAVYLDHDLGGETFVDSDQPNTGMGVVRWMVANRPYVGRVVVHSLNSPAANRMVAALRDAGYEAEYVNFLRLVRETP